MIAALGASPTPCWWRSTRQMGAEAWRADRYELGAGLLLADRDHHRGRAADDRLAPGRCHLARPGHRPHLVGNTNFRSRARCRSARRSAAGATALHSGGERRPDAGARPRSSSGTGGLGRHRPPPHRPPGAAIHDVDAHRGGRRDLRAEQLRRTARRGRDDRRAAVVERPPRARDRWASSHLVQHQDRSFSSVETGELVIARFMPAGYEEVDRMHLLTPITRTRGGGSNRWRNVDRAVPGSIRRSRSATSSRTTSRWSSACR